MKRSQFIALLAGFPVVAPFAQLRRDGKISRVGFLGVGAASPNNELLACWRDGLLQGGSVEGKDYSVDYRWADGIDERLSALMNELASLHPDVVVAYSTPAAQAARRVLKDVPVVFAAVSDPVASGLVTGLARPGGNITGISNFLPATTPKLLDLLKAVSPALSRVAVLHNPGNPGKILEVSELRSAGAIRGIGIDPIGVRQGDDVEPAFSLAARDRADGMVVLQDGVTLRSRERIIASAAKAALPTIYQISEYVKVGGLMSYGLNYCDHFRRVGVYVDKVMKGVKRATYRSNSQPSLSW